MIFRYKSVSHKRLPALLFLGLQALICSAGFAEGLSIQVIKLAAKPVLDGRLRDWPAEYIEGDSADGLIQSAALETAPSYINSPEEESQAQKWKPRPRLLAGVHNDRFYIAAQWHDDNQNNIYRPWKRRGNAFRRDRKRDDMFAVRFEYSGDFNSCMMSGDDYIVDIWRWSAGRSQLSGIADDMTHRFSLSPLPSASVYQTPNGPLFFKKDLDAGNAGWKYTRQPNDLTKKIVAGVVLDGKPAGSRADVSAKARWSNGLWTLELSRKLHTDDRGDVQFTLNSLHRGQVAIFNAGYRMRKQITPTITFDFNRLD